jgi:hypothetical protein
MHGLFYSSEPEAMRAFLRDKLRLPCSDIGDGWLIFDVPVADLGVHPIDDTAQPPSGTHDISFTCDDIQGTVAELQARGVRFDQGIEERGYGFVTAFTMPGGVQVLLYEPKYTTRPKKPRTAPKRGRGKANKKSPERHRKRRAR